MKSLALILVLLGATSCRSAGPVGPYAPPSEAARDTAKAEKLTRAAADLIGSDAETAEALLREALTADLFHGPAHNNLGVLFLKQQKLYEAAQEFEWAKKLLPGHPDPRVNLALCFEEAGRTEDALASYTAALEINPGCVPAMQGAASLVSRTAKEDARLVNWLRTLVLEGDGERWRQWARSQLARTSQP